MVFIEEAVGVLAVEFRHVVEVVVGNGGVDEDFPLKATFQYYSSRVVQRYDPFRAVGLYEIVDDLALVVLEEFMLTIRFAEFIRDFKIVPFIKHVGQLAVGGGVLDVEPLQKRDDFTALSHRPGLSGEYIGQVIVHGAGEVLAFESMHLALHILGGIGGSHADTGLKQHGTLVSTVGDQMHGDAGLSLGSLHHGAVYMDTIHPLATVFGQERGVDIHNAVLVALHDKRRHHEQESGQHYQVNAVVAQQGKDVNGIVDLGTRHHPDGHTETLGTAYHAGLATVAHHKRHFDGPVGAVVEILDEILGVGVVARGEYRYVFCFHICVDVTGCDYIAKI